jgi:hypothetical protein
MEYWYLGKTKKIFLESVTQEGAKKPRFEKISPLDPPFYLDTN